MQDYARMERLEALPNTEAEKPPPRSPGQVGGNTPDPASPPGPLAQMIYAVFALPALASREPPQVWRMTQAPLQGRRRRRLLAWVVVAGRVVGERRKAVVPTIVVVVVAVVAVVVVAVEALRELVGWPACWKREPPVSSSSSERTRPSLGQASFCSNLSCFH